MGKDTEIEVPEKVSNKEEALALIGVLYDKVMKEVMQNEELVENLRNSTPDADKAISQEPF